MAQYKQFYGGDVPVVIDADPDDPLRAWTSHRARLRAWVDELDEAGWTSPTRCPAWDARGLVQHLASGAAFLGWTLHQSNKGVQTELLAGMDTHTTVEAATAALDAMSRDELVAALHDADANIARVTEPHAANGWTSLAEAPPGHLPAHLALSHFLWDSWVHEHDLLLPVGQQPVLDPFEATTVAHYLAALATVMSGMDTRLEVRLTDLDVVIGCEGDGRQMHIRPGQGVPGAPVVEGPVREVCDRATGRSTDEVGGDPAALAVLDSLAAALN